MSGEPRAHRAERARNPARLDRSLDAAILDAALAVVAERGYEQMTMDEVASRAGVGKAAIYRRWPSKATVVAEAIAHWRRGLGSVQPPNTGSVRGDIEELIAATPARDGADAGMMSLVLGVATAAIRDRVLAAALDDLVLSQPRRMIGAVLHNAVARGDIPPDRDVGLIADAAVGLTILRAITGRPIDRVFVRRVLEDVILPLATTAD